MASSNLNIKTRIKRLVLKRPDLTTEEIMERLAKDGGRIPSRFTVASVRAEFKHSWRLLYEYGYTDHNPNGRKHK